MKKDVIYIDIEDDITAVIDKLKNSSEKIVALVPPKGNAVLQSVVNLKLLKRAASSVGRQPVVVTNNQALTALAGGLDLYVAKNLQSKPVLASGVSDEPLEDEEVEVSDDGQLSEAGTSVALNNIDGDADEVELSGEELADIAAENSVSTGEVSQATKPKKSKSKAVPNFDTFRKKLLIGGGIALLLLVVFFALFGRAKSSIVVRAEATPVDVAFEAKLNANSASSDPDTYNLKAAYQEKKQTVSQSFTPTGEKDIGQKAAGKVKFSNGSPNASSVAAGSKLTTSSGLVFTVDSDTAIPAAQLSFSCPGYLCPGSATANVTAAEAGTKYNGASGGLSGAPSGVSASFNGSTSGGTSQVVKVVTQGDVDKAKEALNQQDSSAVKDELKKAFGNDVTVLEDSLTVAFGNVGSEPGIDQQANEAKLTAEITYSLLGVPNKDLGEALDSFTTTQMTDKDRQRVYDNGLDNLKFEKVNGDARTATYKVSTITQYGPQFDTEELKAQVAGKKFGEARSYLQDLPGVKGVDIKLSPFWARKLPGVGRIQVSLDVDKNTTGR